MKSDVTIDRSKAQKIQRIELARLELRSYGYSIIRTSYLKQLIKRLPIADRAEAMVESAR